MNDASRNEKPLTSGQKAGVFAAAIVASGRVRLFVAAVLFIGWMAYLGYAALTKNRGPVVSHAQVAAATHPVVAEVAGGADGKPAARVRVVEPLSKDGPAAGTEIFIANLPDSRGFDGPGPYLLLVMADPFFVRNNGADLPPFALVGQQRSPGNDLSGVGKPAIYPWTEEVRKQFHKLWR